MPAVWLDGYLYPDGDARLPVLDHSILVGDGVFETCKVIDDEPFALRRHLDRLARSAEVMGLEAPDAEVVRDAARDVLASDPGAGVLRITLTSGVGPLSSARGDRGTSMLLVTGRPAAWGPTERVAVVPWPRNERGALAGVKTTSYAENVVALRWARQRGAGEAIFANTKGELCEGTSTNVFLALDGVLVTPPLESGCLSGVTRELLVEALDVAERALPVEALAGAAEVFLTSSTREVHPVEAVDGRPVASCPGPLTRAARQAFDQIKATSPDP